jgi:hypothetical protein
MTKNVSPIRQQLLLAVLTLLFTRATGQQVAPVYPPQGGFHIEGDLRANTPTANVGDWLMGPGGTGGYVMSDNGMPLDTATTIHVVDLWNSSNDDLIIGQANDNPNDDWGWGTGNVIPKVDLNNVLIHFTRDSIGCHKWMMFAADRWGTAGISYVDFELLQNTLTRNINGTFTSAGSIGGRTANDLLITVEYTNGGSQANIDCYKWDTVGPGIYDYVLFSWAPPGSRYGFTSSGGEPVPYTAFDDSIYLTNQFVEGMLDLDAIVQVYLTTLDSIVFKTITVKTKVSAALSAVCADMIAPVQINNLTLNCWLVGIEENPWQINISISPNPAQDNFTVSMKEWNGQKAELSIFDVCGRLVYQQEMHSQLSTIRYQLTKGLYLVTIAEGPKQFTQKLVID